MGSRKITAGQITSLQCARGLLDEVLAANRAVLGQINALPADVQAQIPAQVRLLLELDLPTELEADNPDLEDVLDAFFDEHRQMWTLCGDLTGLLAPGDTNNAVGWKLTDYMRAAEPQLLARVDIDPESDCFYAYTSTREDALELVLTIRHLAVTDHARLRAG